MDHRSHCDSTRRAEGSGGRYTDPLTTLAWLGGLTTNIKLGVGVLIVPYRPALPTIKQILTVQELTGDRLLLGLAVGWMDAEFQALGVDRRRRGRLTDEMLMLMNDCFENDVVTANGQPFIVSPRPAPPPVYIGGAAPHALERAVRFGHGWLPLARDIDKLEADIDRFQHMAAERDKAAGPVTVMAGLPLDDPGRAKDALARYSDLGIERLVCGMRYDAVDEYLHKLDALEHCVR